MPNWANNTMIVYGDKKQLNKFADLLKKSLSEERSHHIESDFGDMWLGNIFTEANFNYKDIACRGWVDYVEYNLDEETPHILIQYESAWDSIAPSFNILLKAKFNKLKQVTKCEEDGMGIYYHTDKDNQWFNDSYDFDCCYDNEYYWETFDTKLGLLAFASKIFNHNFLTINEIEDSFVEKSDDDYCSVRVCRYESI